jgi:spermidine synthase
VVCFDHPRWYVRPVFSFLLLPAFAAVCWALFHGVDLALPKSLARVLNKWAWLRDINLKLVREIVIYAAGLFVGCMVCLGELYRLRPHPRFLTSYYLMLAAGGALGGVFVALVAPLVFNSYLEFHIGVWACAALLLWVCLRERSFGIAAGIGAGGLCVSVASAFVYKSVLREKLIFGKSQFGEKWLWWCGAGVLFIAAFAPTSLRGSQRWTWRAWGYFVVAVLGLGWVLINQARNKNEDVIAKTRNFYGVLTVLESEKDDPERRHFVLQNGRITHGIQATDPKLSFTPTSYYSETSGIGLTMRHFPRQSGRRIGVVGLGTGTMAAYGRKGDVVRIYDINPQVRRLAESRFSYLRQCPARVEIVMGDARLSMEAEPPQQYDVLVLDAFSSDAIPVHLLTKEAGETYLRHLKPDGVLAVHISNRYLDLEPVVANLARYLTLKSAVIDDSEKEWWSYGTTWVLLTRNAEFLALEPIRNAAAAEADPQKSASRVALWTDDYASLFPILK